MKTAIKRLTAVMLAGCIAAGSTALAAAEENPIPAKYDSREHGYVTSVKAQTYGTCWAHSTIAACETSLVKNNGFTNDLDLSELHLAYYATHRMYDRLGLFDSEVTANPGTSVLDGNFLENAAQALTNMDGVVPDNSHYNQFAEGKMDYSGLHAMTVSNKQLSYALSAAQLSDYYAVTTEDLDLYKSYIMRCGGGAISTNVSDPVCNGKVVYNYEGAVTSGGEHGMCVVGWDDSIPAEQLTVNGHTPSRDGAFIVKDSGGLESGDNGYLLMPYEDETLRERQSFFFSFRSGTPYTYTYAYDDLVGRYDLEPEEDENELTAANVYTAVSDDETLEAVAFYPENSSVDYEIKVYTGVTDLPTDGMLKATVTGSTTEKGYRTVTLNEPVSLKAGEKFSVVLTVKADGKPAILCDGDGSCYENRENKVKATKVRAPRESFFDQGYGWEDLTTIEDAGNVRLKAFTNSPSAVPYDDVDDFHSYDGKSREQLLQELRGFIGELDEKQKLSFNYNIDFSMGINNYQMLAESIVADPIYTTAAEMSDIMREARKYMSNPTYRRAAELIEEMDFIVQRWAGSKTITVLPEYQAFLDVMDAFDRKAANLEFTADNFVDEAGKVRKAFSDFLLFLYETGTYGSFLQRYGDVNNDGVIDINDVTAIQKILAGLTERDYYSNLTMDVNGDYEQNINDATDIQKFLAGITDHLAVYDNDFGVEDEYTADTDRETLTEYLRTAVQDRAAWEDVELSIFSEFDDFNSVASYNAAKAVLADAQNQPSAILLFHARHLIGNVSTVQPRY